MSRDLRLVSVVIPVFNSAPFLSQAVASVLAQDYTPFEVIVVDDGSTDNPREAAARHLPRVTWIEQKNRGNGAARNAGVRAARGEYLAFLDADDYWLSPSKLRRQIDALNSEAKPDIVFGHMVNFVHGSEPDPSQSAISGTVPGTMILRRDVFESVGLFSDSLRVGVFIDWLSRVRQAGLTEVMLDDVVLARRVHGGNTSMRAGERNLVYARLLKARIDARRMNE
ncbi:MAG: glycosyltransferase family 2 protein [Verrucomicrobia bacterium]|nr:glycosyltransferase family 2 protein [Verrucomicrobiota bacterium]